MTLDFSILPNYQHLLGILLSVVFLGLPIWYAKQYYEKANGYRKVIEERQLLYEKFEEEEILPVLSEFTDYIHIIISDQIDKGHNLKTSDVVYGTLSDRYINSKVKKYKRRLHKAFNKWLEIEENLNLNLNYSSSIAQRCIKFVVWVTSIIILLILYQILNRYSTYIMGVIAFVICISLREVLYMRNERTNLEKCEKQYLKEYSNYKRERVS